KLFLVAIASFSLFITPLALAVEAPMDAVRIDIFERPDCGHCQAEKAFLNELANERGDLILVYHDIFEKEHKKHFIELAELEDIPKVTPITIIDGVLLQGFSSAETTGKKIENLIESAKGKTQYTFEEFIAMGGSQSIESDEGTCDSDGCDVDAIDYTFDVPFIGPVNMAAYSLHTLSLVLGFVDGFNPCAMWVLVMFLTILAEAGSRRRMFEMAGLFIFAEAIMYYLILNVWMTAWDFVGLDRIITPIVGFVAVAAGSYFLWLFYKKDTSCKVGSLESKRRTQEKIRGYATAPMTIMVALGVLALAFSVNIIEFACSIGIPQTFTKILDMNYLSWTGKQFYNALYILMYMVDDLIVFGIALYSFDKIGLTTHKYTRASHFIGGLIMLALGLIMLVNPTLLVFG
ncbi:thioredoxin family protein, partial [Candidatus Pacearchaeota archaeon]|nr:thioredoxin family protein [Candidatus Pacearchaeota archaeon]